MPADLTTLSALKARVEAATGSDRELDAEIWWAFADHSETDEGFKAHAAAHGVVSALNRFSGRLWLGWTEMVPIVTGSVDAALALVERMLPKVAVEVTHNGISQDGRKIGQSFIWIEGEEAGGCWDAASAPLAILSALLDAKISQLEEVPHAR